MIDPQLSTQGTASKAYFYRRYRPPVPRGLLNHILGRVKNGGLLDLGCGTGRVAVALAPHFREVVAVDPDAEMVDEGRKHALEARVSNINWHVSRAEEFAAPLGKFDLITIGDAFHRLDQDRVLEEARCWLADSGGIAIIQSRDSLSGTEPWHRIVADIVE
jgi:ubiquinone/menaquinone biosynthesis C-methylase UbiE